MDTAMRAALPLLLALSAAVPHRLAAQSPADRAALEALRDSLTGVRDSIALKRLEAAGIELAKRHRDDSLIHLRLGFLAYRLGEVTGAKGHYDDAAGEFEWAGELAPDWPYPWYGLGLAEFAQGEAASIAIENIREQLGKDYMTKAARAFARAVQADPAFAQPTIDLAPTAGALALSRADRSVVGGPDEITPFDGFPPPGPRAEWLEHFWRRRDVAEARNPGERLAEHSRRWFYAWREFRLVSRHRHYDITERYRSDQAEFDDRGIIYLRHRPPDKRASYQQVLDRIEPNETWLYRRPPPEGDLIFHFVARGDVQDFKLVESLADALTAGHGGALTLEVRRPRFDPVLSDLFASRAEISPVYARLGNTLGSTNTGRALADERTLGQRSIAVGTTTDRYTREVAAPLGTVASEFVVGTVGGGRGRAS